jgi:hypothetical protein
MPPHLRRGLHPNWATPARVPATINTVKVIRNYEKCPATQWINKIQWKAAAMGAIALQRHIIIIPKNANGPTIISPHVRLSLKEYDDCFEAYQTYVDRASVHQRRIRWEKFDTPPIVAYDVGNHYNSLLIEDAGNSAVISCMQGDELLTNAADRVCLFLRYIRNLRRW